MNLEPVDPALGEWIAPRLAPFASGVGAVVPTGFEAYARVLHPVETTDGWCTWADVAARTGVHLHPLSQFWRVAGWTAWDAQDGPLADHFAVQEGSLTEHALAALVEVLASHTEGGAGAPCVTALWVGYGWDGGASMWSFGFFEPEGRGPQWWSRATSGVRRRHALWRATRQARKVRPGQVLNREVLAGPQLELPGREYFTLECTLATVVEASGHDLASAGDRAWWQSPNLLWPLDLSWCVASEIDLASTYVGGSESLIAALLADERLEAFPTEITDPISYDSDSAPDPGRRTAN